MTVARTKKPKGGSTTNEIRKKAFEEARWYVAKTIFPNFITFVLMGVIDELDYSKMKNFNLTQGEKQRLIKSIVRRSNRYCEQGRLGQINPYEARQNFEKSMGIDLSEVYL